MHLLFSFGGVGVFPGFEIRGSDCRLCDDGAVQVRLGQDEPIFGLAQHDLEMAVLASPLRSFAPGDDFR